MPTFHSVRLTRTRIAGTVRINDVPLPQAPAAESPSIDAINMWITGRSNRVTFVFDWLHQAASSGPELAIAILANIRGANPPEARVLASFHWPAPGQTSERPPAITFAFEIAEPPPSTLWATLHPLVLDDATRNAVNATLAALDHALDSRDAAHAAALLDFKAVDLGAAMYFTPENARKSQADFLSFFLERPTFRMEPYDPARMTMELVADGRVVMVKRDDGSPALQSVPGDGPSMLLPVFLAPIHGRWTVVR